MKVVENLILYRFTPCQNYPKWLGLGQKIEKLHKYQIFRFPFFWPGSQGSGSTQKQIYNWDSQKLRNSNGANRTWISRTVKKLRSFKVWIAHLCVMFLVLLKLIVTAIRQKTLKMVYIDFTELSGTFKRKNVLII